MGGPRPPIQLFLQPLRGVPRCAPSSAHRCCPVGWQHGYVQVGSYTLRILNSNTPNLKGFVPPGVFLAHTHSTERQGAFSTPVPHATCSCCPAGSDGKGPWPSSHLRQPFPWTPEPPCFPQNSPRALMPSGASVTVFSVSSPMGHRPQHYRHSRNRKGPSAGPAKPPVSPALVRPHLWAKPRPRRKGRAL